MGYNIGKYTTGKMSKGLAKRYSLLAEILSLR